MTFPAVCRNRPDLGRPRTGGSANRESLRCVPRGLPRQMKPATVLFGCAATVAKADHRLTDHDIEASAAVSAVRPGPLRPVIRRSSKASPTGGRLERMAFCLRHRMKCPATPGITARHSCWNTC